MRNPFGSNAARRRSSSIDRTKVTIRGGVAAAPVVATPAPVPTVIYASTDSLDGIGNLDDDDDDDDSNTNKKSKRHLFARAVAVRARLSKSNKEDEARQAQSQSRSLLQKLVKKTPPPPVEQVYGTAEKKCPSEPQRRNSPKDVQTQMIQEMQETEDRDRALFEQRRAFYAKNMDLNTSMDSSAFFVDDECRAFDNLEDGLKCSDTSVVSEMSPTRKARTNNDYDILSLSKGASAAAQKTKSEMNLMLETMEDEARNIQAMLDPFKLSNEMGFCLVDCVDKNSYLLEEGAAMVEESAVLMKRSISKVSGVNTTGEPLNEATKAMSCATLFTGTVDDDPVPVKIPTATVSRGVSHPEMDINHDSDSWPNSLKMETDDLEKQRPNTARSRRTPSWMQRKPGNNSKKPKKDKTFFVSRKNGSPMQVETL